MPRTVAIGNQNFEELIKRNCFYVDKTGFIEEWWNSVDQVTIITRPRRFGKTLNMNMMNRFFSNRYKGDSFNPFEHLIVWKNNELREQYCEHPVIFLSFAGIKSSDFSGMKISLSKIINELVMDYIYVFRSNRIDEAEKAFFHTVSDNMKDEDISTSLRKLSRVLNLYYGRDVIILLDEYDTPCKKPGLKDIGTKRLDLYEIYSITLLRQIHIWNVQ